MTFTHGSESDRAKNVRDSVAEQINRISLSLYTSIRRHETQSNHPTIPYQPASAKMTCLAQLVLLLHDMRRSLLQFNIGGLRRLQGYGIWNFQWLNSSDWLTLLQRTPICRHQTLRIMGDGCMKRLVKRRLIQSTLEEISLELDDVFVCISVSMQHFHLF